MNPRDAAQICADLKDALGYGNRTEYFLAGLFIGVALMWLLRGLVDFYSDPLVNNPRRVPRKFEVVLGKVLRFLRLIRPDERKP